MDTIGQLIAIWLNPIHLGFFLVCAAGALWILSRTGDHFDRK